MESPFYQALVRGHLLLGVLALATFWLQMALRKRGAWHRRVGQVYFLAMSGVVVTALAMTVVIAATGRWGTALFLTFLAWLTLGAGGSAWMAARWRGRRLGVQRRYDRIAQWGLLAISLALLASFQIGGVLFVGLGGFGAFSAVVELRRPADHLQWRFWQVRHIGHVLGTGIAVHIAFFSFGLGRILGDAYQPIYFLVAFGLPAALGSWGVSRFTRRYRDAAEAVDAARARQRAAEEAPVAAA